MIKIHKYEMIGIGASIALMALALFLMRVNGTVNSSFSSAISGQEAAVILAENNDASLKEAFTGASSFSGSIEKLVATDIIIGDGKEVKKGSKVTVNYIGTLQNGQEFDNSYKKGETVTFKVGDGKVIKGWNEGLLGMKEGGQRILVVPANMAYGKDGYGPVPGNVTVVYAIELVGVK